MSVFCVVCEPCVFSLCVMHCVFALHVCVKCFHCVFCDVCEQCVFALSVCVVCEQCVFSMYVKNKNNSMFIDIMRTPLYTQV